MSHWPKLPLWRLPIIWLFTGPPIFRGLEAKSAAAALEGGFDVWNFLRFGWWLFFGAIAIAEVYRQRWEFRIFRSDVRALSWWIGTWLATIVTSTFLSPAPAFTFANACLLAILIIAAADLAMKLAMHQISQQTVFVLLHNVSTALLLAVGIIYIFKPNQVGVLNQFGPRLTGGGVAEVPTVALIVSFTALYLLVKSRGIKRLQYWLALGLGLLGIVLSQTRTAYVALLVGLAFFVLQWIIKSQARMQRLLIALICLVVSAALGVDIYADFSKGIVGYERIVNYLVRNPETLKGMSGRDGVTAVVIQAVRKHPLGLGYSAGPRALIMSSDAFLATYGVIANRIGNAHNAYIEVLGGSGFLGALAWVGLLSWLLIRSIGRRGDEMILMRVLFLTVLLLGITSSSSVLPFTQTSVLLWILVASISSYKFREDPSDT